MELIFRVVMWFLLLLSILFVPTCLYFILRKYFKRSAVLLISISFLLIYFVTLFLVSSNPFVIVPSEYEIYIDAAEKMEIRSYNSGFYSMNIPFFPIFINVVYADESTTKVSTTYFPLGSTTMTISDTDVPCLDRGIFN